MLLSFRARLIFYLSLRPQLHGTYIEPASVQCESASPLLVTVGNGGSEQLHFEKPVAVLNAIGATATNHDGCRQ
jgi:hypothetical protein